MFHHRDYHLVLDKALASPLTLTERDFAVAHEFGGPQEEQRVRSVQRKAQLATLTTAAAPLQTKAVAATAPTTVTRLETSEVAKWIGLALKAALPPRDAHLKAVAAYVTTLQKDHAVLTRRVDELEALTKTQAATLVDLSSENKALGQFIADTNRRPPSSDRAGTKH